MERMSTHLRKMQSDLLSRSFSRRWATCFLAILKERCSAAKLYVWLKVDLDYLLKETRCFCAALRILAHRFVSATEEGFLPRKDPQTQTDSYTGR